MTTATGEYVFDFKTQSTEDPFSDPAFTLVTTESGRIYDNGTTKVLRSRVGRNGSGKVLYQYTGGTYDGGDVVARAEVIACNATGDDALVGLFDENGDGYYLRVYGNSSAIRSSTDYGSTSSAVGSSISQAFTTGDVYGITVTKGSPNTIKVYHNGTLLRTETNTLSLGTLKACVGTDPNDGGNAEIGSFAVDGLVTSSPTMMGAGCF